jgi:hypothetical protein
MRRDPLIIHLYDKSPSRRSYRRQSAPSAGGTAPALLACGLIAAGVVAFFWAYDALAHRGVPFVPVLTEEIGDARRSMAARSRPMPLQAPAPDLHSPAVLIANGDVPLLPSASAEPPPGPAKEAKPAAAAKPRPAEVAPRKRRTLTAKHLPAEAAQAYASEPGFFRVPLGGF